MLTEALGRPELYRRRGHGEVGGGAETKRAVRAVLGSSGVLGCTGRRVMSLRSKTRGQLGPIRTGGVKLWRRGDLTGLEIRTIPARRGQSSGRAGLGRSLMSQRSVRGGSQERRRCGEVRSRRRGALLRRSGGVAAQVWLGCGGG